MKDKNIRNTTIHERIKMLVEAFASGKNTVFAQSLGISEANIRSYIRGVVPKADVLEKIVITYDINAMWLLTGLGNMTIPNRVEVAVPITSDVTIKDFFAQFEPFLKGKEDLIIQQAEEIGRLKAELAETKRHAERLASLVNTDATAHVG